MAHPRSASLADRREDRLREKEEEEEEGLLEKKQQRQKKKPEVGKNMHHLFVLLSLSLLFLSIILWVLRDTARLSKEMHDDHASFWVPLEIKDLSQWYSPLDVCLLSAPSFGLFDMGMTFANESVFEGSHLTQQLLPQMYRRHRYRQNKKGNKSLANEKLRANAIISIERNWTWRCRKQFLPTRRTSSPLFCRISNCQFPIASHTYFRKALHPKITSKISRSDLVKRLMRMSIENEGLAFIGDSISKQNIEALACELTKNDESKLSGNMTSFDHIRVIWKNQSIAAFPLNLYYIPFNGIRPSESSNFSTTQHKHHRTSLSDLKKKVEAVRSTHPRGVTLVVSIGSSYYSRMKFRDDIASILDWLDDMGRPSNTSRHRVLFRENAAQHWNHTEHGYQTVDGSTAGEWCTPLQDAHASLDWRNREVASYIHNEGLENIEIIPFRNITAPLFNMHAKSKLSHSLDCTNFCFFPQLWQVVWSYLV